MDAPPHLSKCRHFLYFENVNVTFSDPSGLAWVFGRSPAEFVGSNPDARMDVFLL
jgi:hypothetical protein